MILQKKLLKINRNFLGKTSLNNIISMKIIQLLAVTNQLSRLE